jgi:putative inorganic carbon (HCO3(-)) transporter
VEEAAFSLMTTALQRFNQYNPLAAAWFFILAVLILLPALIFSSLLPDWAPLVALVGLLVLFVLRGVATGRVIGHTPADGPLLLLLLTLPVGLWVSSDPTVSLPRVYALVAGLAFFWAVAAQRDAPWLRRSGWLLLLAGLVLGFIFLLGTRFGGTKLPFINREIYTALPGGLRPFWNPEGFNANLSGGMLALFWAPALVLAWRGDSWQQRDMAKLVVVALTALLFLTQSRGALLGCIAALMLITVLQDRRWLPFWLIVLLATAIVAYHVGPALFFETILGQSDIFGDRSLQGRQELWGRSMALIRDYPLTGVGLGMVEPAIKSHYPTLLIRPDRNFKHAHNLYLQAGAEMGLPGLIAHLVLYGILAYLLARRVLDRGAGYYPVLALGLLGTLVVFLTHGLFEVITYATRAAIVVWGLFGLMVAVSTSTSGQNEDD